MKRAQQPELPGFVREASSSADSLLTRALSELAGSSPPPQLLRERLLATVARPRLRYAPFFGALSRLFDLDEIALADLFERAESSAQWSPSLVPNTELLHFDAGPGAADADNGLVRMQPGARFPMHRHLGPERVLVLEGAYRDEQSDRVYRAGDLHEMAQGSAHAYSVLPERPLLLAVSVVRGVDVEGYGTLSPAAG